MPQVEVRPGPNRYDARQHSSMVAQQVQASMNRKKGGHKDCSQQNGRLFTPAQMPNRESPRGSGWPRSNSRDGGYPTA